MKMKVAALFACFFILSITWVVCEEGYILACNHTVFCQGEVLQKIQMAELYPDSKTFVDMPLKENFSLNITKEISQSGSVEELRQTVRKYFDDAGKELEAVDISEPRSEPKLFAKIKSREYRSWAKELCLIWKKLVRQMKKDVRLNSERYSLLYLSKSFVVPGGRFREIYYWDTYWSIEGLLQCGMIQTTKNILQNLLHFVETLGFVPNGGRKYYQNRSQPPFLTLMMEKYLQHSHDMAFVEENFDTLVKEHRFWVEQRAVTWSSYTLNQYHSKMGFPRPESYREDVELMKQAGHEGNSTAQKEFYSHIASAAESGWDFSSRWFKNMTQMTTIQTNDIIPVDLNSILCAVEFTLARFASKINNKTSEHHFNSLATKRKQDIDDFFWNDDYGLWLDFDQKTGIHKKSFYASSLFPLWLHTMNSSYWNKTKASAAYQTLKNLGVFSYPGGLPTSLNTSGQQWDFPNAWPPLQHIAVYALTQVNIEEKNDEAKDMARALAQKYLESAFLSWKTTGHMYEKYDVRERSKAGHGGEYDVQDGFGWTNGVALEFLSKYGQVLNAPSNKGSHTSHENIFIVSLCLFFTNLSNIYS